VGGLNRRTLLQSLSASAALTVSGTAAVSNGKARLYPGCCAYSYGRLLGAGQMTMETFICTAADLGVVGVELTSYWWKSTAPAYLASLRNLCFTHGLAIDGAAIRTQICQPEPKQAETVAEIQRWVDAAALLGAPYVRVFADKLPAGATEAQGIDWAAAVLRRACDYSAQKGIVLGIETHLGLTANPANLLVILRRVDSPYAACNLDISNWNERPYEHIEACLPYAVSAHVRDYWGPDKEPLDLDRVFQLFAARGYRGFFNAEYEDQEAPQTGVPKLVDKIKALCRKYSI